MATEKPSTAPPGAELMGSTFKGPDGQTATFFKSTTGSRYILTLGGPDRVPPSNKPLRQQK